MDPNTGKSDDTVTVRITLRRSTADKLRALCHARNETASMIVDRWILTPPAAPKKDIFDDMFGGIFGGKR